MAARKKNEATRLIAALTGLRATRTPIAEAMSGTAKIQKTTLSARSTMLVPHPADDGLAGVLGLAPRILAERAAPLLDVPLEVGAELLHEALHRVELGDARERPDHAGRVVHHDDAARPGHRAGRLERVELHRDVDLVAGEHRRRGPARNDGLHLAAAHDPAAVLHDDLLQVVVDGLLVNARAVHVT